MNATVSTGDPQSAAAPPKSLRPPAWKRALDITLLLASLPASLPLFAAVAVVIRIVAGRPVFFRQERVGLGGRRFQCWKFRTMHAGANVRGHEQHLTNLIHSSKPMTKLDSHGDKRIIPMGRALRATGLDELPQLINVLRGEMSLVGPRPCIPYEHQEYLPWQHERFNTLPGLTGLWQVSGKNKTTFEEMIRLDITYARRSTPWLDVKIIAATLPALAVQVLESRRDRKPAAQSQPVPAAENYSAPAGVHAYSSH